jgi:succinate dehydrogenase/fumarate reductase cytochrome b subunit
MDEAKAPKEQSAPPSPTTPSASEGPGGAADTPDRWRRLHTLSGAGVLALFVVEHLITNASALAGEGAYARVVGSIERWPLLPLIELLVLVPLGYHAGYGILRLGLRPRPRGTPDAVIERYGDGRLWGLQRISAAVLLVFLLVHLWELRLQKLFFGLEPEAFHTVLSAHLSWTWAGVPWVALFYVLGLAATAFHFSNGLFAATAEWRRAEGSAGYRRVRIVTALLGAVLFLVGATTVVGFATGTRLLPAADGNSAPCGPAAPSPPPPER